MDEYTRILLKVAKLYYQDNFTQQEIGEKLCLSRPKVSRMLQQAREQNIVQIRIFPPSEDFTELEINLERKFGLKEVVVACVDDYDSETSVMRELGIAAAKFLHRIVQDNVLIGFTWGGFLSAMSDAIIPENKNNLRIIQMVGGLGEPDTDIHAIDIVKRAAITLNAKLILLPAPGIVETGEVHRILLSEKTIKYALDLLPEADIAFVGIEAPGLNSMVVQGNVIDPDEMEQLIKSGAVGDIGLRFFDIQGNPIECELADRVIGASLPDLRKIPQTVGVAGGREKLDAILGAVRGNYINTLVTDQRTARQLLN